VAWEYVFADYGWAVAATALFVVISQLKINVTNAYASSLAWSNFFARLTRSHPGCVVWMVFNTLIALMLMELDLFQALGRVLPLLAAYGRRGAVPRPVDRPALLPGSAGPAGG
jgi:purine-cytosine permease-like protein